MEEIAKKRESFIKRALLKHGNKFDYSHAIYVRMDVNITIICPSHGEFTQKPRDHLSSQGCVKCSRERLRNIQISTRDHIINRSRIVHGDIYDYSLVENSPNSEPIKIICKYHGVFEQTPGNHYAGKGCNKCGIIKTTNSKKYSRDSIINEFRKIHGDRYNYDQVEYTGVKNPVKILCNIHGLFEQMPKLHKIGMGCTKCGYIHAIKNRKIIYKGQKREITTELAIERFREVHGDRFDYSNVIYVSAKEKVKIICRKHGIYEQSPDSHLRGQGCDKCNVSKGETEIIRLLNIYNILFEQEKRFDTCKNIHKLPFDFYLPQFDALIEFDGKQHFESIEFFGGKDGLIKRQINDKIKTDWAYKNNKQLLRIRYNDNVEEKMSEFIERLKLNDFIQNMIDSVL